MIGTLIATPALLLTLVAGEPPQASLEQAMITERQNRSVILPNVDRDTGLAGYTPPRPCRPLYNEKAVMIGSETGSPEKNTFARTVTGCR